MQPVGSVWPVYISPGKMALNSDMEGGVAASCNVSPGFRCPGARLWVALLLVCFLAPALGATALEDSSRAKDLANTAVGFDVQSALYVEVLLSKPLRLSSLRLGHVIEGSLAREVYSGDHALFQRGSPVRLTLATVEHRRRGPNDHWPGVIGLFAPKHQRYPTFQSGWSAPQAAWRFPCGLI